VKKESPVIIEPRSVVLFVGQRGSGKSTRRKAALEAAWEAGQRRLIAFDVMDEDSQHGRKRESVVLGPLKQKLTTVELAKDPGILREDELSLAIVPVSKDPAEWAADFAALVEELEDDDEAPGTVLSASELAVWAQFCPKAVDRAACLSRHWGREGCALLFDAQRATGIPFTTRTQATDILSGKQTMPADLDALGERCGERYRDEVSALQGHDFRHWRDTDGRWERAADNKPGKKARRES
jgi:energy-coupling factor transporter ATP-binding protein EcfA2